MPRLPDLPDLDWKPDGTPVSGAFDDVYFSLSDGLEETRSVFLKACGLPERWSDRNVFTIAELGFGSGLNFLGTLDCWLNSERKPDAWLQFVSVEKFLMTREDASRVLSKWPAYKTLSDAIIEHWPVRTRGLQRIVFPEFRATLTLYVGDVLDWLKESRFYCDAWFLDGFSPAKNTDMWSEDVFPLMASHSAKDCMVGTYTVAGAVRRGLRAAGFEVEKRPGFGRKRERLEAIWPHSPPSSVVGDVFLTSPVVETATKNCVVIGAGIAGATTAFIFSRAGYNVSILDEAKMPAAGASGNAFALSMPRLDAADTEVSRFLIQSYLYAGRFYEALSSENIWRLDVEQRAQNEKEIERFRKLIDDPPLDHDWLSYADDTLIHKQAICLRPDRLVPELIEMSQAKCRFGVPVGSVPDLREEYGQDALIIFTTGWGRHAAVDQMDLPLVGKLGQVERGYSVHRVMRPCARASGSYAIRFENQMLFGATFDKVEQGKDAEITDAARLKNLRDLEALASVYVADLDPERLVSRASIRATTPDRMPIAGAVFEVNEIKAAMSSLSKGVPAEADIPFEKNLFCSLGHGSRGFTFAPVLAEHLLSLVLAAPSPLSLSGQEIVSTSRFVVRDVKRGR